MRYFMHSGYMQFDTLLPFTLGYSTYYVHVQCIIPVKLFTKTFLVAKLGVNVKKWLVHNTTHIN